jgi:hypothetical protein
MRRSTTMNRYVIERDLPGVGRLSEDELETVRERSNAVLSETGAGIQWVESFITAMRSSCPSWVESTRHMSDAGPARLSILRSSRPT